MRPNGHGKRPSSRPDATARQSPPAWSLLRDEADRRERERLAAELERAIRDAEAAEQVARHAEAERVCQQRLADLQAQAAAGRVLTMCVRARSSGVRLILLRWRAPQRSCTVAACAAGLTATPEWA